MCKGPEVGASSILIHDSAVSSFSLIISSTVMNISL